jgi:hypothetical protein
MQEPGTRLLFSGRTVMPEKDTCNHQPPATDKGGRRLMKVGSKN